MPHLEREIIMPIKFTKMQGCANDYIYINCLDKEVENPSKLAIEMSKRHFSVGSDGLVLICKSDIADFKMRMFNLDGSEGNMCGNAIRCVGKFVYDGMYTNKNIVTIETKSGIKTLELYLGSNGLVESVKVSMGKASFKPSDLPLSQDEEYINKENVIGNETYLITAVSMGNPHCVIFKDNIKELELDKIGPTFESNPLFPTKVNTEFVEVIDKNHLNMRVYERGSGETYACGTGSCATVAAACINGICPFNEPVYVNLIGGTLEIVCDSEYNITMKGPAKRVFDGVYYED